MIYRFGQCRLDIPAHELRVGGLVVPLEPQVFQLLRLLIENRDRVVGRDEIIDEVWRGRIVSEAAISSRVKSARRAIGDDGATQGMIRTSSKLGFRFVAEVECLSRPRPAEPLPDHADSPPTADALSSRPSIAVLPFSVAGTAAPAGGFMRGLADGLPHDLIAELSRLRWLFVVARGSSFRFRGPDIDVQRVGAALKVRYCLSGVVETDARRIALAVELSDTQDGGVVWTERFQFGVDRMHEIREQIVRAVTSALELQIPMNEARKARLSSPENLDAWSAYHLGLGHMYRFSREGTAVAAGLFERAIGLEPGFARAHAGLSFTHFENAFLNFADNAGVAAALAQGCAETAIGLEPLDPFCNLVMGRAFWLRSDLDASLPWIDRAIALNPNYAQAKYSRAWTEAVMGQGAAGLANVEAALDLSPLDPMVYGMLGVRALSHMVLDEPAAAAHWGELAARSPGAHALIEVVAAVGHGLNGDDARAMAWARSARGRGSRLTASAFFDAFPFREPVSRRRIATTLDRLGI